MFCITFFLTVYRILAKGQGREDGTRVKNSDPFFFCPIFFRKNKSSDSLMRLLYRGFMSRLCLHSSVLLFFFRESQWSLLKYHSCKKKTPHLELNISFYLALNRILSLVKILVDIELTLTRWSVFLPKSKPSGSKPRSSLV